MSHRQNHPVSHTPRKQAILSLKHEDVPQFKGAHTHIFWDWLQSLGLQAMEEKWSSSAWETEKEGKSIIIWPSSRDWPWTHRAMTVKSWRVFDYTWKTAVRQKCFIWVSETERQTLRTGENDAKWWWWWWWILDFYIYKWKWKWCSSVQEHHQLVIDMMLLCGC